MHLCGLIFLPHPLGSVSTRLVTGLEEMEDGWDKKRGRSAIHCGQLREAMTGSSGRGDRPPGKE